MIYNFLGVKKKMNPDKNVKMWPKLYTYPKHRSEISFSAPHFLNKGLSVPLCTDVFSGCYVQLKGL